MKHIVHIIPSLQRGGAEQTLIRLITHTNPKLVQHSIICLKEDGPLLEQIRPHLKHFIVSPASPKNFFTLIKILKEWEPDAVQTWMYNSNIYGGLAAKLAGIKKIFWNIRITKLEWKYHSFNSFVFCYVGSLLSYFIPHKIIYCSKSGVTYHENKGYCYNKSIFIPNGLETEAFTVSSKLRETVRTKWHIQKKDFAIGMLARFHPQKDFATFFKAADLFLSNHPQTKFILAGYNITPDNPELLQLVSPAVREHVILLGDQTHVKDVLAALDLFTLASMAEGFPNVVAEAMACSIPAVASHVGDAAEIIGDTGWIVPPREPITLASAWDAAWASDLKAKGAAARKRIEENFSMEKMIDAYTNLYIQD